MKNKQIDSIAKCLYSMKGWISVCPVIVGSFIPNLCMKLHTIALHTLIHPFIEYFHFAIVHIRLFFMIYNKIRKLPIQQWHTSHR